MRRFIKGRKFGVIRYDLSLLEGATLETMKLFGLTESEVIREFVGERKVEKIAPARLRIFQSPEWLRKGIGDRIVKALIEMARKQKIRVLIALIEPNNIASQKTAEKNGFRNLTELKPSKNQVWVKEV